MGLYDQARGSGLPFIANLLAQVEATGWGSAENPNQNWGGRLNDANIIENVSWGAAVDPFTAYFPHSPVNTRATQHCVCDDFIHCRHQERLLRQYNQHNTLINTRVHRKGQYRDGSVTQ